VKCRACPSVQLLIAALIVLTTLRGSARAVLRRRNQGANLVAEGIPPIPKELAQRVERYTEFRSAVPLSWHPQRREMLIATRFADTAQIHTSKCPAARARSSRFSRARRRASVRPTSGESYVFSMDAGGNEFDQLYRFDLRERRVDDAHRRQVEEQPRAVVAGREVGRVHLDASDGAEQRPVRR
jgi:hypothetical protein